MTVIIQETGEMFGEEALVVNLATTATAIAEGPVSCVGMDRAKFTQVREISRVGGARDVHKEPTGRSAV